MHRGRPGIAEQIQKPLVCGVLLNPVPRRPMIQKQTGVQVILQVHLQHTAMFVNLEKLATGSLFFILAGARLALALLAHHVFPVHAERFGNHCKSFGQTFTGGTFVHRFRGRVLLHVYPALIDIDCQGELRHVGIVKPIATNALLSRPLANGLHIFLEPVTKHGRTFLVGNTRSNLTGDIGAPRGHGAGVIDFEQQQLSRQFAVEKPVLLVASQTDGLAVFRGTGKHTKPPAGYAAFHCSAQGLVQGAQFPALTQALTVWRIGQHQPMFGPVVLRFQGLNRSSFNVDNTLKPSPLDILPGRRNDPTVLVKARQPGDSFLFTLMGATFCFLAQGKPELRLMARPFLEAKLLLFAARRHIQRHHRGFNYKRAGPTHRVQKIAAGRGNLWPARTHQ